MVAVALQPRVRKSAGRNSDEDRPEDGRVRPGAISHRGERCPGTAAGEPRLWPFGRHPLLMLIPLGGTARSLTAADLAPNSPDPAQTRISQFGDTIRVDSNGAEPLVLHVLPGSRIPASRMALLAQWIFAVPLAIAGLCLILALSRQRPRSGAADGVVSAGGSRSTTINLALVGTNLLLSCLGLNGSSTALWRYYPIASCPAPAFSWARQKRSAPMNGCCKHHGFFHKPEEHRRSVPLIPA